MRYGIVIATACLLAGCQQKTGSTTITTNSQTGEVKVSGDAPAAVHMQPGQWDMKVTFSDFKMANMPKGASAPPPAMTHSICLTPEQAAKGPGDMLKNSQTDCTVKSNTYAGGRISTDTTCKMPGGDIHMTTDGTYTPTSLTTDSKVETTGEHAMTQTTHTEAHRVGECVATAK